VTAVGVLCIEPLFLTENVMRRLLACLLCLFLAPVALAEPANANHVAADARWYVHLDVDAAKKTVLFDQLLTAFKAQIPIDEIANTLKTNIGVNPLTDISGITVYNNSFEKDVAAIVVYAKIDAAMLNSALANNPDYKETEYKNHMLLGWTDNNDGKHKNGCFYRDGIVLMADKIETLKWAVDVMDGTKPAGSSLVKAPAKGTFLNAAAELGRSDDPNIAHVLSATEASTASVGETDGKLHVAVHVTTQTPAQALQIKKILEGLAAFGELATRELPAATEVIKQFNVTAEGNKVQATLEHDSKTLLETLQEIDRQKKAQKK
jgi:hypothetical protein